MTDLTTLFSFFIVKRMLGKTYLKYATCNWILLPFLDSIFSALLRTSLSENHIYGDQEPPKLYSQYKIRTPLILNV